MPMPTGSVVVCGHPDAAKAMFTAPFDTFDVWAKPQLVPIFGNDSIFTVHGEAHRRHRRAIVEASKKRGRMLDLCRDHIAALRPGQTLPLAPWLLDLSLRVILDVVLGVRHDEALTALVAEFMERSGSTSLLIPLCYPSFRRSTYPPWAAFSRLCKTLRDRLRRFVSERRTHAGDAQDMLSVLVQQLDDDATIDDVVTLLIAGHETTAYALAFATDLLAHTPSALEKLHQEIEPLDETPTLPTLAALPYLDAVCDETLRLHPVAVQVTRELRKPFDIAGYSLSPGVSVAVSAYLVQHRADLFPDPESFRPERFLERQVGPFEYFPFGGGPTRCLGASMAKDEMKTVLFYLLRRFSLRPKRKRPSGAIIRGLVTAPEDDVVMTLVPR